MRTVIQRMLTAGALVGAAILLLPPPAATQSLGEAAERAKKERKGTKPAKVITESDLRRAGTGEGTVSQSPGEEATATSADEATAASADSTSEGGSAGEGKSTPPKRQKSEEERRAEIEANWRQRLQQARADASRLSAEAARIQASLNDLTQNLYGTNRASQLNRLEEVKKLLSAAQQLVSDLEEEGRRSRYLGGQSPS